MTLQNLILKSRDRQQVLKQKVQQNQRVELQVAISGALQRKFDNLDHNLANVEPLMRNKLSLDRVTLTIAAREFVNRLSRAELNEVLRQRLHDLVGFQSDLRFTAVDQSQQVGSEVRMGDQVRKDRDVRF